MKANELRIGNLLNWNGSESPIQAGGIYLYESGQLNIIPEPIPLTEEWLVRFGFVKKKRGGWYVLKRGSSKTNNLKMFHLGEFNDEGQYNTKGGCMSGYIPIIHVHQLQNLYFALTGEELSYE